MLFTPERINYTLIRKVLGPCPHNTGPIYWTLHPGQTFIVCSPTSDYVDTWVRGIKQRLTVEQAIEEMAKEMVRRVGNSPPEEERLAW